MCRSGWAWRVQAAVVAAIVLVAPAQAQRIAISRVGIDDTATFFVRETSVLDLTTARVVVRVPRAAERDPVFTADGRYLVFSEPRATPAAASLVVVDLQTGGETVLPIAFVPFAPHPRVVAVFGASGGAPARLDLAGLHVWPGCGADIMTALDVAVDGTAVAVICASRLLVLDAVSGAVQRVITVTASAYAVRLLSPSEALVVSPAGLERYDLVTGQVLAARRGVTGLGAAGPRDAVAVSACVSTPAPRATFACRASLADSQTLADLSPVADTGVAHQADTTNDRRLMLARGTFLVTAHSEARLVDVPSGVTTASVFRALNTYTGSIASPPTAPVVAPASVAGAAVRLAWTLPPESAAVTGYRLEAGLAPGATAVALTLGPAPAVAIPGVPSGRYYARLRAVNDTGVSGPSNEIVIDVP